MALHSLPTVVDQIIALRARIGRLEARNDCACDHRPIVCESCKRLIGCHNALRELEREPEGEALLARELAEFKARTKGVTLPAPYCDMNDFIPF